MSITLGSNILVATTLPLDAKYIAADNTARDAIVAGLRYPGMQVFVTATDLTWQLQGGIANGNWVAFGSGSGGGAIGTGYTPSSTFIAANKTGTYYTKYAFKISSGNPVIDTYMLGGFTGGNPITYTNNGITYTVNDADPINNIVYAQGNGAPTATGILFRNKTVRIDNQALNYTSFGSQDLSFVVYDQNGSVGIWFNFNSTQTIPAGAAACTRAIEIGYTFFDSLTTIHDTMVAALDADSEFTCINDPAGDPSATAMYLTLVDTSNVADAVDSPIEPCDIILLNIGQMAYSSVNTPIGLDVVINGGTGGTTFGSTSGQVIGTPGANQNRALALGVASGKLMRSMTRYIGAHAYGTGTGTAGYIHITEIY